MIFYYNYTKSLCYYRDHAIELKNPVPTEPFVFLKPTTSYITEGQHIKVSDLVMKPMKLKFSDKLHAEKDTVRLPLHQTLLLLLSS